MVEFIHHIWWMNSTLHGICKVSFILSLWPKSKQAQFSGDSFWTKQSTPQMPRIKATLEILPLCICLCCCSLISCPFRRCHPLASCVSFKTYVRHYYNNALHVYRWYKKGYNNRAYFRVHCYVRIKMFGLGWATWGHPPWVKVLDTSTRASVHSLCKLFLIFWSPTFLWLQLILWKTREKSSINLICMKFTPFSAAKLHLSMSQTQCLKSRHPLLQVPGSIIDGSIKRSTQNVDRENINVVMQFKIYGVPLHLFPRDRKQNVWEWFIDDIVYIQKHEI